MNTLQATAEQEEPRHLSLIIPSDTYAKLQELAQANERSTAAEARYALRGLPRKPRGLVRPLTTLALAVPENG